MANVAEKTVYAADGVRYLYTEDTVKLSWGRHEGKQYVPEVTISFSAPRRSRSGEHVRETTALELASRLQSSLGAGGVETRTNRLRRVSDRSLVERTLNKICVGLGYQPYFSDLRVEVAS